MPTQSFSEWLAEQDNPYKSSDLLRRKQFARRIANGLCGWNGNESLVTAIYGQWGCGKTWLLHQIVSTLESEHSTAVTVRNFAPWQYASLEQITAELFQVVQQAIKSSDNDEGKHSRSWYWAMLSQLTLAGQLGVVGISALGQAQGIDGSALAASLGAIGQLLAMGKDAAAAAEREATSLPRVREKLYPPR